MTRFVLARLALVALAYVATCAILSGFVVPITHHAAQKLQEIVYRLR